MSSQNHRLRPVQTAGQSDRTQSQGTRLDQSRPTDSAADLLVTRYMLLPHFQIRSGAVLATFWTVSSLRDCSLQQQTVHEFQIQVKIRWARFSQRQTAATASVNHQRTLTSITGEKAADTTEEDAELMATEAAESLATNKDDEVASCFCCNFFSMARDRFYLFCRFRYISSLLFSFTRLLRRNVKYCHLMRVTAKVFLTEIQLDFPATFSSL